jgi:glycosyltransferase involved in cell wall biosynthesis
MGYADDDAAKTMIAPLYRIAPPTGGTLTHRVTGLKMLNREVAVATLGARRHYAVPLLLHRAGLLDRFFTDSYAGNKPQIAALLRPLARGPLEREIRSWLGRAEPGLPPERVISFERLGLRYAVARRNAKSAAEQERIFADTGKRFAEAIMRKGLGPASIIWGYNTASRELFEAAKVDGRRCVVEQTMLPGVLSDAFLQEEVAAWPKWQPTLIAPQRYILNQREQDEWELADYVVAGSRFVADGLAACGVARDKVRVVPYGVDPRRFPAAAEASDVSPGPLRVLFVGEVGLRKGVPYLLSALARLGPRKVVARFAGGNVLAADKLAAFKDVASFLGPVPRSRMPDLFSWAQVVVHPSIVEGSAAVTYEAMLSGLPVITTPNAGSTIRDGIEGRIVPIRDSDAIADALLAYIEEPRLMMTHAAGAKDNRQRASLERYGTDLVDLIKKNFSA